LNFPLKKGFDNISILTYKVSMLEYLDSQDLWRHRTHFVYQRRFMCAPQGTTHFSVNGYDTRFKA